MSQTPYGPDDLASPPLDGAAFLGLLADNYQRKMGEPPEFFRELLAGKLTKEQVQSWVKDQYFYWDNLYYSTAAIYIKTNEHAVRAKLLRRLVWVEGKSVVRDVRPDWKTPAYEELLIRLGIGLGLTREEIEDWQPYTRTFFSISTLCLYSRGWEWSWLDGIANLYASDLFYRDVLAKARAVLADSFGTGEEALSFFDAVIGDAEENIAWEEEVLAYWACTTERQLTAARAFRERLDIEGQCLVGVTQALSGEEPFRTPKGTVIPDLLGNEIVPVQVS